MKRGKADIFQYATKENTEAYFEVFENCNIGTVKGTDYLAMLSRTLRKLWKQSPLTKKEDMWEVLKRY
jgi:cytochrome b involved in lipid metabolism